ncbi:hypothetical protein NIES4071_30500 [Calothrix sp. NIES-4071]|nr:hypothetical protein NIES4071_30500 [Calothrix sp. NIES-4071]BAZ57370.1 hypothetical protein NIES4105_30440 [Calothrix sp. NIES-4105]
MTSEASHLFVSFWHVCLNNLPVGEFNHRLIHLEEARTLITLARQQKQLLCVSNDDLLAPYHERALNKHRELCEVLQSSFGIHITLQDFVLNSATDSDEPLYSITPLQIVQVQKNKKLLVITCSYEWLGVQEKIETAFKVSLSSIEFHLFEQV